MKNVTKASLDKRINAFAGSEKTTKEQFGEFSREVLMYVYKTGDINMVNRALEVLSPVHKRIAYKFFPTFLAWEFNKDSSKPKRFGKKLQKEAQVKSRQTKAEEFSQNESNTIWTWQEKNVEVTKKPTDWGKRLGDTLKKGTSDDAGEKRLTTLSVATALMESDINLADLMKACELASK